MKVHIKFFTHGLRFCSCFVDLRQESIDLWGKIFFINHIEAYNHICMLSTLKDCIDLRLDVLFANNLQSAHHDLHLEQWKHILNLLLDPLEDLYLLDSAYRSLLIEYHSKDVLPLNNCHALFDEVLAHSVQNHLEELFVVVKL